MASSVARSRELRGHLAEPLEHDLRVARRVDELAGVERGEDRHEVLVQLVGETGLISIPARRVVLDDAQPDTGRMYFSAHVRKPY